MRDIAVLCGHAALRPEVEHALRLDIDAPKGSTSKINLKLANLSAALCVDIPERLTDLLQIACYVYCADQFTPRDTPKMRNMGEDWRRRFHFHIPVRDAAFWNEAPVREALSRTIGFLSEDEYHFAFEPSPDPRPFKSYLEFGEGQAPGPSPDRVVLFSGGLDSFGGAAEALLEQDARLVLVSHHGANMLKSRQTALVQALSKRVPKGRLQHVTVQVNKGRKEAREFTQRARSFLFASLGFVVASLYKRPEVTFYENGVLSLNLPIAEHLVGSRATRTTHPHVLAGLGDFFSLVAGDRVRFVNPFFWRTKSEVIQRIDQCGCAGLIPLTVSCAHVRQATKTGKHCGVCSQCVDRRFSMLGAGLERFDPKDLYEVDLLTGARVDPVATTLAESYVLAARSFARMDERAFRSRFGHIFRALPYLEGDLEENARRIHHLHARHGGMVVGVVNKALRESAGLDAILALPPTSLLAMIRSTASTSVVIRDPVDREPPPSEQAADPEWGQIPQPIWFAVHPDKDEVVFVDCIRLKGRAAKLIRTLLVNHNAGRSDNFDPARYSATRADKLANQLGIEEATLRQNVSRIRRQLETAFQEHFKATLDENQIIENVPTRGYRLNPRLAQLPYETAQPKTPKTRHVSQGGAGMSQPPP